MTFSSKPQETVENGTEKKFSSSPNKNFSAEEIDQFAVRTFAKKCEQFHEDPRPFAAFILNISGELHLISFACSPTQETDRKKLLSKSSKNQIIHKNPLVLARRGFIRFLIKEVKKKDNQDSLILMLNEEGELQLKPFCQVYMYSTYSYVCENVYWGLEAMKTHDTNHCIMNKIRRWVVLGVQGALVSNIFVPIHISKIIIGSTPPVPINDIWRILFQNLDIQDRDFPVLESVKRPSPTTPLDRTFVWYQGLIGLDIIGENGKLELEGNGSSVCKEEIFKAYLQLDMADKTILKYSRAKKKSGHYQLLKKILYKKWESENNGKWLKRKSNKVDKFWIELNNNR